MAAPGITFGVSRPPAMEAIVRPFVDVLSFSSVKDPAVAELPPPEAFLQWGDAAEFQFDGSFRDNATRFPGFHVDDPPDDDVPPVTFTEDGRSVTVVRVENPEDSDQFVDVERINVISFQGPGGKRYIYRLRN